AIQERARELGPTIIIELQADCLAGAWAGSLARDESDNLVLVDDDLQEAIGGYLVFRDPLGTPAEDPSAHGSGFDRITAFFDGFNNDAEACVDYDDDPPPIADIDLTPEDLDTGGDLELEILQPLVVEELESYWTPLLEASFDVTYVAPTLQPYGPDTELPACGGEVLDVELYRESAFFCTADNALMWDDEVLVTVLWTEVGDGASMYVLVNISAQSALVQADFASDAADFSLLAECLTGSFFADLFLGNLDELFISAGDLDELLIGVSRYTPALPDANGRSIEGIAERIGAIRRGFDNGFSTCVGG
ncbi:MAG: neutral zinc metallopeptidase, partial [Acidimicrobiia bacterium]|nr:neutral zinc metallopeptidase [Acidimicrobiia bacterium]